MVDEEPHSESAQPLLHQEKVEAIGRSALLEAPTFHDYFKSTLSLGGVGNIDADELASQAASQREAILAMPSWEEGLDMERVNKFCERKDIPLKPLRVLNPDDYEVAMRIAGGGSEGHDDTEGRFLAALDVVLVRRDPETEALNGPGYTESMVVHERKHSATKLLSMKPRVIKEKHGLRRKKTQTTVLVGERVGFETKSDSGSGLGKALEEGSAELERGEYIIEELGLPDGFVATEPGQNSSPLNKYLCYVRQSSGEVAIAQTPGAIPAVLLEELCRRDPQMRSTLKEGHESMEALEVLSQRLDNTHPGLYQKILAINLAADDRQSQTLNLIAEVFA